MEPQEIDITKLQIESLQALAYRLYKQRDNVDQSLSAIEAELNRRAIKEAEKEQNDKQPGEDQAGTPQTETTEPTPPADAPQDTPPNV